MSDTDFVCVPFTERSDTALSHFDDGNGIASQRFFYPFPIPRARLRRAHLLLYNTASSDDRRVFRSSGSALSVIAVELLSRMWTEQAKSFLSFEIILFTLYFVHPKSIRRIDVCSLLAMESLSDDGKCAPADSSALCRCQ